MPKGAIRPRVKRIHRMFDEGQIVNTCVIKEDAVILYAKSASKEEYEATRLMRDFREIVQFYDTSCARFVAWRLGKVKYLTRLTWGSTNTYTED